MAGSTPRRLLRSQDRKIAGVCGGIAEYLDVDPTLVRLGVAVLALLSFLGPIVLAYGLLWIVVPESDGSTVTRSGGGNTDLSLLIGVSLVGLAFIWVLGRGGIGLRMPALGWGGFQMLWIVALVAIGLLFITRSRRG
ncbi:MAG: PspC domain-containing protein [Chloroflexi bacterium]|nr:PspC domain-containing protein [Chloroflexota bacterium]MDA1239298.1 PspC domain-containing protein [Chloroflexota bacterium]